MSITGQHEIASVVLQLRSFGVAFGDSVVLNGIDLEVPRAGVVTVMGPGGAGKSTLLRTLAGVNQAQPLMRTWGDALFDGAPLLSTAPPALVGQNAQLVMATVLENLLTTLRERVQLPPREHEAVARVVLEGFDLGFLIPSLRERVVNLPLGAQRLVAVARTLVTEPKLLLLDETTAALPDDAAERVLGLIRKEAERRAILFVTHNRRHAEALGGSMALLAGGRMIEQGPTQRFFSAPQTPVGAQFVRTGSCAVPSPGAKAEDLDDPSMAPARPELTPPAAGAPRGFTWIRRGRLAGTPRPGIVDDVDHDLTLLRLAGVTHLVCLEERQTTPAALLERYGITGIFFPIIDMGAPSLDDAADVCRLMSTLMKRDAVIAVHCRAGLGRTGTMLAAYLIYEGRPALAAVEDVRALQPKFVQSQVQLDFLASFSAHLRGGPRNHAATAAKTTSAPPTKENECP